MKDNAVTVGTEDVRILAVFEPKQSWLALARPAAAAVDAQFFTTVEEKWYKVYSAKMDEWIRSFPDARFGFIHLDSDDIPELVCFGRRKVEYTDWLPDSYTPDSVIDWYEVYTIRGGQAQWVQNSGEGLIEYVARSGKYRYVHLYAATGPNYYYYDCMGESAEYVGKSGCVSRDLDITGNSAKVHIQGFSDLYGSRNTISADAYLELMKTIYPVTADAREDTEIAGASYGIRADLLAPKAELNILK